MKAPESKVNDALSPEQAKHAARALDLLTIVARGLQETQCPAMALVAAAQDLLLLSIITTLALGAHQGEETFKQAVEFTWDAIEDLQRETVSLQRKVHDQFSRIGEESGPDLNELMKIPTKGTH